MSEKYPAMEQQVLILEQRLAALEAGSAAGGLVSMTSEGSGAGRRSIGDHEVTVMRKLDEARARMLAEAGDIEALRVDRDSARAEAARLRKENEQLKYRVMHLVRNLNAAEAKSSC